MGVAAISRAVQIPFISKTLTLKAVQLLMYTVDQGPEWKTIQFTVIHHINTRPTDQGDTDQGDTNQEGIVQVATNLEGTDPDPDHRPHMISHLWTPQNVRLILSANQRIQKVGPHL